MKVFFGKAGTVLHQHHKFITANVFSKYICVAELFDSKLRPKKLRQALKMHANFIAKEAPSEKKQQATIFSSEDVSGRLKNL